MTSVLTEIEAILAHVERLARQLHADPDGFILRSAIELRTAFDDRAVVGPAFERVRISVRALRQATTSPLPARPRPATTLDFLDDVLEHELLPRLRRSGFDV